MRLYFLIFKARTTSGLDLCPDFMEIVVGQASFRFRISQKSQRILVGISVENSKLSCGQFNFTLKKFEICEVNAILM